MSIAPRIDPAREPVSDTRAKADRAELSASKRGAKRASMASTATAWRRPRCSRALSELVTTYGEDATAKYAEGLPARIRNGEFSIQMSRQ